MRLGYIQPQLTSAEFLSKRRLAKIPSYEIYNCWKYRVAVAVGLKRERGEQVVVIQGGYLGRGEMGIRLYLELDALFSPGESY